jgi:hypothetical protein
LGARRGAADGFMPGEVNVFISADKTETTTLTLTAEAQMALI